MGIIKPNPKCKCVRYQHLCDNPSLSSPRVSLVMGWRAIDYPMDTADILTLIGGIGGMQGIIELLKWWRGRKLRDRHDIADVKA